MSSKPSKTGNQSKFWFLEWLLNWTLSTPQKLREAEKGLLSHLKMRHQAFYVDIGAVVGQSDHIWTISLNAERTKHTPIVALHGLGGGSALWLLNLEALAKDHAVYAIDILGFGRSSRPLFSAEPLSCERQMVEALEAWRSELKLRRVILLGHSLGAFIASSYALTYPERVQHLLLANAWGFNEQPRAQLSAYPLWLRVLERATLWCNPYWILRAAGPFGTWLIAAKSPELLRCFAPLLGDQLHILTQYIHQCNAAMPSGEAAFHTLSEHFAYAKQPLLRRISELPRDVGITFIYGADCSRDAGTGVKVKKLRENSQVHVIVIEDAGEHVHVEQPELFNSHVLAACQSIESQS